MRDRNDRYSTSVVGRKMSDLHYFFYTFFHDPRWFADRCKRKREKIGSGFVDALKTMEGLPVWLVIRLCTDEPKVRDFLQPAR
jgi:hypothetical protein